MTCASCRERLEPTDRYCSSCGRPTLRNADCQVAESLDDFWLAEALKDRGYSIRVNDEDPNAWKATAPDRPSIFLAFSPSSKLILFMVEKTPKDQSPFGKIKGFQYINTCNNGLSFWKARWDDRDNTIYFSFMLAVSEFNFKERIHRVVCPVLDEMLEACSPS